MDTFWDNALVHPSRKVEPFKTEKKFQLSSFFTSPFSLLDLIHADYLLFLKLKRDLAASPCPPGQGREEVGGGSSAL
jgi:hypothetical protein